MLQAADLTIRLHPDDDVVIARLEIPTGTLLTKENVRAMVTIPAGHKIAVRAVAAGQAGAPLQPDHRLRHARHRRRRPRARAQHRDGRLPARLCLFVPGKEDRLRREPGHLHGHRARRRPRGDAQLHRHPLQRELLGDRGADDRAALREPPGRLSERGRRRRPHPQDRLRHGERGRGHRHPAPHDRRLRAPPEFLLLAAGRPGLRGEPDQQPAFRSISSSAATASARSPSRRRAARARRWKPASRA